MGLIYYPDPILRWKAEEVRELNGEVVKFAAEMADLMRRSRGAGLAAPQVGRSIRLIVVDLGKERGNLVVVNPVIVFSEGEIVGEEGCLSFPGLIGKVMRAERVGIKGIDLEGKDVEVEGGELLARAMQHEVDHLEGTLLVDRLTPASRVAAGPWLREIRKKG